MLQSLDPYFYVHNITQPLYSSHRTWQYACATASTYI